MHGLPSRDELFQSPAAWIALFGEAPCGYLLTDPKGQILLVNDTLLKWLHYDRDEVEEKMRFQDLLPVGEKIFYETRHTILLKLQEQVNELNYNLIGKDGNRHPTLVNSTRHFNQAGEFIALQFVFFLFSDRKKYEQELLGAKVRSEQDAAAKASFLSTISHEIRTPIHAILNATQILVEDKFSAEQNELLQAIDYSSRNLLDLVNSVLDLTKMETGKVELNKQPFSVEDLMHQLLIIQQPLAQKKGIDFKLTLPEHLPKTVIGDEGRIRQVLTNLIGNAIKFTIEGRIELKVNILAKSEEAYTFQFVLSDTGIGISEDELTNIFDPFTQANQSIHQKYGGTGLGLSISLGILQLFESEMKVESKLGEGSVFAFELTMPVAKEVVKNEEPFNIYGDPKELAHLNILVVDDTYTNILVLKRYFELWGITSEYVLNGKAAIEKVKKQNFDLILMDISMPEMDGYETSRIIRSSAGEEFPQIPIIALSAFDVSEIIFEVKRAGMNDTLSKPFKAAQLYETLLKWAPSGKRISDSSNKREKEMLSEEDLNDHFSLKNICDLFDGDADAIKEFLKNVVIELNSDIKGLTIAKERKSMSAYRAAVHNLSTKVGWFNLQVVKEKIAEGKQSLKEGQKEKFESLCDEIASFLEKLMTWLQKIIDKDGLICAAPTSPKHLSTPDSEA